MLEPITKRQRKKGMVSADRADFIWKCGKVWKSYVAEKRIVVITDHKIAAEDLFQEYFDKIVPGIKRGLVILKTLDEVTLEDMTDEKGFVEF